MHAMLTMPTIHTMSLCNHLSKFELITSVLNLSAGV